MRRLFSTFAQGWPGVGLLILRLVAGCAVVAFSLSDLPSGQPSQPAIVRIAAIVAGALLSAGLLTPVSGCLVSALASWVLITQPGDPWGNVLLAAIGIALAMIGPGVWSLDARLFGWRRISIPDRRG